LGPGAAGPVASVALVPGGGCRGGGGGCAVTIRVNLTLPHPALDLAWAVEVVNRCTGQVSTGWRGTVAAAANYTYVYWQPTISLPAGTPVVLIGTTSRPVVAASSPVAAGPPGAACPR
ncbi:MAG TPA: hypothetical protein VMW49_01670, partial [Candidatus Dormibacteraeota bacterium]|nr:hypothetical protein [Candidatus Dormibacteraeota bacterium]